MPRGRKTGGRAADGAVGHPNPVDIHVGGRVRLRRTLLGFSQERLGDAIGLTFQQVQKYERGANRIGSSRLFDLARVLEVPAALRMAPGVSAAGRAGARPGRSEAAPFERPDTAKRWSWCAPTAHRRPARAQARLRTGQVPGAPAAAA
jgi:transcriptional regulator with XRE-family HTH domain